MTNCDGGIIPGAMSMEAARIAARSLELIVLDVDGVLTDGKLYFSAEGEELKRFDVKDGHGIVMARKAGLVIAIISGRASEVTTRRARELGIEHVYQGAKEKDKTFMSLVTELDMECSRAAFMGDDVIDINVMKLAGLSVAVADAHPDVLAMANIVTARRGGDGAVRQFIDFVMRSRSV